MAEAVMGISIERNADTVVSQMYAPFLSNLHYNREGKPRLIRFDVDPSIAIYSVDELLYVEVVSKDTSKEWEDARGGCKCGISSTLLGGEFGRGL